MRAPFLPLGLDLQRRVCVVVGGGAVGARKARALARAGAEVRVVAPEACRALARLAAARRVRWVPRAFRVAHLRGAFLAVAATDDAAVNAAVIRAADRRGVLACDASSAARSRVIFGALLERDGLTVAVFSGGRDPARSRAARDTIGTLLDRHRSRT